MIPRILIIAGSDSGGGAGIQADIKTVSMLGGYAMTAITALTAQNTQGVFGIHPVPPDFIRQQIRLVADDIGVDVIKTGMLHNADVIEAVADTIASYHCPLILDPVMISTSGSHLLEAPAVDALKTRLLPFATLITPNIPEAELLSGHQITGRVEMEAAAQSIAALGAKAVLIKGGHLTGDTVHDLLWQNGQTIWFTSARIDTPHTHGTGCTLASAIATEIGKRNELAKAVENARHYVHRAIETAPGFGKGHGPLNHLHPLYGK